MDARSINPSGESNPTCDIDGNENMKQGTQAPDDTRIDILDQETSDTIGASVIAESLPYDVQSSSPMAFPSSNDADGTVLNFEVPDRQEEQNDASPTRIYFLPQDADSSATSTAFSGGTDYKPAVRVEASKFTKFVWKADIQEGLHDVRIVVNLKNLKIEEIETLSITQYDGDALEIFTGYELRECVGDCESRTVILGLHRQYLRGKASEDAVTFTMEFRTLHDPLPQGDPGYIELKYIELSPSHSSPVVNGVIMHQPFLWSVDVKIETTAQKSSGVIVSYSVSGDGNYVATLSTNGTIIQLDVWDLQLETQTKRGPFTPKPCGQLQLSISNDVLSDPAEYQAWRLERAKEELSISVSQDASMIALMCGKGKVDKALLKETFQLFSFENTTLPGGSEERKLQSLDNRIDAHLKTFRGFGKFHLINGRYSWMQRYITGRKTDMQHFIACDETYVDIYSIDKEWKRTQRIIHSSKSCSTVTMPRSMIEGIRGNMISWLDENTLRVCDLETGKLVHAMTVKGAVRLSKDGLLMAHLHTSKPIDTTPGAINTTLVTIEIRWTRSGTIIATTLVKVDAGNQPSLEFIDNDSRIIISSVVPDHDFGRGAQGVILDTTTLSFVERVSYPTNFSVQQPQSTQIDGRYLFSQHGSKLDLIRLEDIVVVPHRQPRYQCNKKCLDGLIDINDFIRPPSTSGEIPINGTGRRAIRIPRTGLTVTVEFQQEDVETEGSKAGHAAVVSISNDQSDPHMIFRTPPLKIRDQCVECNLHVDPISNHLITDYRGLVMVWKLPTTLKDSITLHTVLKTQPSNDMPKGLDESTKLKKCRHGQAYTSFYRELLPLYGNWTGNTNFSRFSDGLLPLISAFSKGDNAFQQAILQFVGLYIDNTLHGICDNVEESNYDAIHTFLEQLFSSSVVRWVPEPGETNQCNPIHRLLLADNLRIGQRASLARIMIDHCLHMSAEKQDWHFLSPVLDSLTAIAYHRGSFPDLIPKIFRKMAFLPVNDISFAVNAQSSGLQWPSREYGKHIINGSNKPILQSSGASLPKEHDQHNRHFAHKLHVAPFEMLSGLPSERNFLKNYRSLPSLILLFLLPVISAIYLGLSIPLALALGAVALAFLLAFFLPVLALFLTVLAVLLTILLLFALAMLFAYILNCGSIRHEFNKAWCHIKNHIKNDIKDDTKTDTSFWRRIPPRILIYVLADYYDFYLEALDHPAVTTLLEYKWNTIGFKYWTVKFAWKSIYYILVLLAVFMQVYDTTQRKEIFIAIIVMASIFLYFEVFQFAYNLLGYFKSPYNYINVLAFALPIMGSVKQLSNIDNNHDGDVSALSYSVLFIFLHIFFELRVFKDVSRFVAMVSRVLYEVRVFLLFFAMGILAFSIAILHLLRGCPADSCENNDVKFPQSFYRALSSTYFFMGGVWDPISNEFENGNWKFLIMMVLYFFFTNILLLNLIIALMNMAFEDGLVEYEYVWRMDMLRCVQRAEIMTKFIPSFRTASDVFPDEIYYYSTKEEMEKFYAKFSQDGDIPNGPDHRQDAAQGSSEPKLDPTTDPSGVIAAQSGTVDLKTVQQIQEALERQQEERHEDLKSELQISREQTITLQEQLRTQKAEFDLQLQTLQDQMSRILAALKVTS